MSDECINCEVIDLRECEGCEHYSQRSTVVDHIADPGKLVAPTVDEEMEMLVQKYLIYAAEQVGTWKGVREALYGDDKTVTAIGIVALRIRSLIGGK